MCNNGRWVVLLGLGGYFNNGSVRLCHEALTASRATGIAARGKHFVITVDVERVLVNVETIDGERH